jgi:MFS-type transporter involved in bile tolerance (Atg22 family)
VAEVPEGPAALTARKKFTMRPVVMEEEEDDEEVEAVKEGTADRHQEVGVIAVINKYINLSLVENPVFLVLAGSVMLMAVGVPHCLFFLPSHVETVGLPPSDASLLLSVSAIFDLTGRIAFGFFLDLNLVPKYVCYSGMMLLSGLSAILLAASSSFLSIATCMALYGIGSGGWFLMVPLLLAEHLGVENIASSYGLVRLAQSTTNLSGPLVAGALFQKTGKVAASFYFMGAAMMLGGVIVLFLPVAVQKLRAKERQRSERG